MSATLPADYDAARAARLTRTKELNASLAEQKQRLEAVRIETETFAKTLASRSAADAAAEDESKAAAEAAAGAEALALNKSRRAAEDKAAEILHAREGERAALEASIANFAVSLTADIKEVEKTIRAREESEVRAAGGSSSSHQLGEFDEAAAKAQRRITAAETAMKALSTGHS